MSKAVILVGLKYEEIAKHYAPIHKLDYDSAELRKILYTMMSDNDIVSICPDKELGYLDHLIGFVLDITEDNLYTEFNPYNVYKYRNPKQKFKDIFTIEPRIYLTVSV